MDRSVSRCLKKLQTSLLSIRLGHLDSKVYVFFYYVHIIIFIITIELIALGQHLCWPFEMYDGIKHSFWYIKLVDIPYKRTFLYQKIRKKDCICKKIKVRNEIPSLYHNALNKKRERKKNDVCKC